MAIHGRGLSTGGVQNVVQLRVWQEFRGLCGAGNDMQTSVKLPLDLFCLLLKFRTQLRTGA